MLIAEGVVIFLHMYSESDSIVAVAAVMHHYSGHIKRRGVLIMVNK